MKVNFHFKWESQRNFAVKIYNESACYDDLFHLMHIKRKKCELIQPRLHIIYLLLLNPVVTYTPAPDTPPSTNNHPSSPEESPPTPNKMVMFTQVSKKDPSHTCVSYYRRPYEHEGYRTVLTPVWKLLPRAL